MMQFRWMHGMAIIAIAGFVGATRAEPVTDTSTAALAFYPAKARAADVDGKAILGCNLTEYIAMRGCRMIYEAPGGYGFGDAALKLAALSNGNPEVSARKQVAEISFNFSLHPPSISPDTLSPYHLTTDARWLARPSGDDILRVYPRDAIRNGIVGKTVLDCEAGLDERLKACVVAEVDPAGHGFGVTAHGGGAWGLRADSRYESRYG